MLRVQQERESKQEGYMDAVVNERREVDDGPVTVRKREHL